MKRFISVTVLFIFLFVSYSFFFSPMFVHASSAVYFDLLSDLLKSAYIDYCKDSFMRKIDENPNNDYTDFEQAHMQTMITLMSNLEKDPVRREEIRSHLEAEFFLAPDPRFDNVDEMPEDLKKAIKAPFFIKKSDLFEYAKTLSDNMGFNPSDLLDSSFTPAIQDFFNSSDFHLNLVGDYNNILMKKEVRDGKLVNVSMYVNVYAQGGVMHSSYSNNSFYLSDRLDGKPLFIMKSKDSLRYGPEWVVLPNDFFKNPSKEFIDSVLDNALKTLKNPHFETPNGTVPIMLSLPSTSLVQDSYDKHKYRLNPYLYRKSPSKPSILDKPHLLPKQIPNAPGSPSVPNSNYPFPNPPAPDKPKFPEQNPDSPNDPEIPKLDFSPLYVPVPSKFPFCIPFDLANSLQVFKSQTAGDWEPVWVIPWSTAEVEVNLTKFSVLAKIVRYFVFAIFINGLIHATRNLIRG